VLDPSTGEKVEGNHADYAISNKRWKPEMPALKAREILPAPEFDSKTDARCTTCREVYNKSYLVKSSWTQQRYCERCLGERTPFSENQHMFATWMKHVNRKDDRQKKDDRLGGFYLPEKGDTGNTSLQKAINDFYKSPEGQEAIQKRKNVLLKKCGCGNSYVGNDCPIGQLNWNFEQTVRGWQRA